jgi:hypothetical protein
MAIAIGDTVSGGTAGSVLFVGAGPVLAQDTSNFFGDDTNKRLGIGTTSPLNGLTVSKSSTGPSASMQQTRTSVMPFPLAPQSRRST